jgi:hypothetical protein
MAKHPANTINGSDKLSLLLTVMGACSLITIFPHKLAGPVRTKCTIGRRRSSLFTERRREVGIVMGKVGA